MMTTLRRMRTRGIASVEWVIIAMVVGIGGLVAFREFKDRYLAPTTDRLGDCVESAAGDGEFCGGGGSGRSGAGSSSAATGQGGTSGGGDPSGGAAGGAATGTGGAGSGAQQGGGSGSGAGAGAAAGTPGAGSGQGGAVTAQGGSGAGGPGAGQGQSPAGGLTADELVGATQAPGHGAGEPGAGHGTGEPGAGHGTAAGEGHGAGAGHDRPGLNAVAEVGVDLFGWGVKLNLANFSYEFYRAVEFGVGPGAVRVVGSPTGWSSTVTAGVVYGAAGYSTETGAFGGTGLAGEVHAGPVHVGANAGVEGGANRQGVYGALTNGGQIAGVGYDLKVGIRYVGDWTAPFRNAGHAVSTWFFPPNQQPIGPPSSSVDRGSAMWSYLYMMP